MEKFLITMIIVGAICFAYLFTICLAQKWLGKAERMALYMAPVILLLSSCDSGGDHTGENWLMLICLLLCWLKG